MTDYHYNGMEFVYDPIFELEPPELEPIDMDRLEAQVTYTAMMTDVLLEK